MKLSAIKENPNNPRQISREDFERLKRSIQEFPQMLALRPIVIDENGVSLGGNMRKRALKALGYKEIPDEWVKRADELTPEQKREFVIKDNGSFGEWDADLLANEWSDLPLVEWGVDLPEDWLSGNGHKEEDESNVADLVDRAAELQEKWGTETGQLWQIGPHRLLIGDCTEKANVGRLWGEKRATCLWTDPPYNVDYEGKTDDALKIKNDSMSAADFRVFLDRAFSAADDVLEKGAAYYIAHPDIFAYEFIGAVRAVGWKQARPAVVLWVKDSIVMGRGDYHAQSEPVLYGWKDGAAHHAVKDRTQSNVWNIDRPKASETHPTMKPVELVARALRNSTDVGALIYEPFAGSGSTFMAAEQEARICYGMEIEPKYCAVTLERMEGLGLKPELLK
jgi:DNA modification methylase